MASDYFTKVLSSNLVINFNLPFSFPLRDLLPKLDKRRGNREPLKWRHLLNIKPSKFLLFSLIQRMKVIIIGGGPAGLAAAKALGKEPGNFEIDLYEIQPQVGGLWNYVPENKNGKPSSVNNGYVTGIYREMETNITKDIMQYNGYPFPEETEVFPTRGEVAEYLHEFSNTIVNVKIHLNSEVTKAKKVDGRWQVEVHNYDSGKNRSSEYDALIVANGHFRTPFFPLVEGLDEWRRERPDSVTHAKFYDHAEPFRGKRVLVVGNSASGIDISTQLSTVASQVYVSSRKKDELLQLNNPVVVDIGVVKSYNPDRSITLEDDSTVQDIDVVMFCTGYLYDVPFLEDYQEEISLKTRSGFRNIYKGLFFIYDPSLIFIALQKQVAPMPLAEAQSVYVARVLNKRINLPSTEDMARIEREETSKFDSESQYQYLGYPRDVDYISELIQEVLEVQDGLGGHEAEYWNGARRTSRSLSGPVKNKRLEVVLKHTLELRKQKKEFVILRND